MLAGFVLLFFCVHGSTILTRDLCQESSLPYGLLMIRAPGTTHGTDCAQQSTRSHASIGSAQVHLSLLYAPEQKAAHTSQYATWYWYCLVYSITCAGTGTALGQHFCWGGGLSDFKPPTTPPPPGHPRLGRKPPELQLNHACCYERVQGRDSYY